MTLAKANLIISKFPKQKVVVLGDIMLDSAIWGKVERISPEAPVPVVHVQKETFVPGGAANVANNVKALDGQVSIIGIVGDDTNSHLLQKELRKRSISISNLVTDKSRPTIRKTRVMGVPQHQLLRIDEETTDTIATGIENAVIAKIKKAAKTADVIVISDYAKGVLSLRVARETIEIARQNKIPVVIDPKPAHKDLYSTATVITPNRKEVLEMAGNGDDDLKAGASLARELDTNVVLTRSEKGMVIISKDSKPKHLQTKAKEVFDVIGAGDTVVAGLALSLASGTSLIEAADIANNAAGVVVGKVGTATLTRSELRKAMKK